MCSKEQSPSKLNAFPVSIWSSALTDNNQFLSGCVRRPGRGQWAGLLITVQLLCDVPPHSSDKQELGVLKVHVTITALCSHTPEPDTGVACMHPDPFIVIISQPDPVSPSEPKTGLCLTLNG